VFLWAPNQKAPELLIAVLESEPAARTFQALG
jgi:hypothetical protein